MKPASLTTNRTKAIISINIHALLIFGSSAALKQVLNREGARALDVAMLRTLILIAATGAVGYFCNAKFRIASQDHSLIVLRCILSTLAYVVFVYGISMVSLLDFTAIFNTLPFWASLLGWVFLREGLSLLEICALFFSFGGVLCVAFSTKDDAKEAEEVKAEGAIKEIEKPGTHLLGCMMILVAAVSYAGVINITRRMQKYNFAVMLFWYAVFAAPVTMFMIFCDCIATRRTIHLLSYELRQYCWILLASAFGFIADAAAIIAT